VNCVTLNFREGAYVEGVRNLVKRQRRPVMKTFITAMTLVFLLATGTSMMALTVHTDRAHISQDSLSIAVYQKTALVY
jgi:hypothetical protein